MDSTIAAGLIAGGTGVITLCVNECFQWLRRRYEAKERFFYEVYGRRIVCHERLVRIAAEHFSGFVPAGRLGRYRRLHNKFVEAFQGEIIASQIFADKEVLAAANHLVRVVQTVFGELLKSGRLNGADEDILDIDDTLNRAPEIAKAYDLFLKTARKEAGADAGEPYFNRLKKVRNTPVKNKSQ